MNALKALKIHNKLQNKKNLKKKIMTFKIKILNKEINLQLVLKILSFLTQNKILIINHYSSH